MKWKLVLLLLILAGCSHYTLKFVNATQKSPRELIAEKLIESDSAYIVVHYTNDNSEKTIHITNIDTINVGFITGNVNLYDDRTWQAGVYREARSIISRKKKKTDISHGTTVSSDKMPNKEQLHLYLYHGAKPHIEDAKLIVKDSQISHAHDFIYKSEPKTPIFMLVFIILLGVGLLIGLIGILIEAASSAAKTSWGNTKETAGCYVATMVYGSYEAREVLILRRFRDNFLQRFLLGRQFIKFYYKYSPRFVQKHQNSPRTKKAIKSVLNVFVKFLNRVMK